EGQPVALVSTDPVTAANTIYYLHTDHLGAVVKATDGTQALVWDAERKPFGERSVTTAQIEMPLGFPGQYFDEETGNYYNYFRDYDPKTGRYLQSDPIGLEGGINTYAYVEGNPIKYIDPLGLDAMCGQGGTWVDGPGHGQGHCIPNNKPSENPGCLSGDCNFYPATHNCKCVLDCMKTEKVPWAVKKGCSFMGKVGSKACEAQYKNIVCTRECDDECNKCETL
ncbi:MAG: RHS repeat domain-containing protein, partial [Candidatus Thiodiazotropha sp.]